jgi:predicted DsbA family dithiol-disulfide isomerase
MTSSTPPQRSPELSPPPAGVLQVWSDLLCPFTHVALHGLRAAREELAPDSAAAAVQLEHRIFPLELFNGPHPRRGTDTEAVGLGQISPGAGFRVWTAAEDLYPHSVLLAAEAVLAAGAQSHAAGTALDEALRTAFWTHSRSIAHRQVILDVAQDVANSTDSALDVAALAAALDEGLHRADVMRDYGLAQTDAIAGSPTFVLPDGHTVTNPGISVHWEGEWAAGYPVVDSFDSSVYADLLHRAAG